MVTHFPPTLRTRSPRFAEDYPLTAYFHNDLEYLMGPAAPVWIHGHTHHSMAVTIAANAGETRIVSNQSGYPDEVAGFAAIM